MPREYAYHTDAANYEGIEWASPLADDSIRVMWIAAGTGTHRQPEATIVGDVIEIRGVPIDGRNWDDDPASVFVRDAAGKAVKLVSE